MRPLIDIFFKTKETFCYLDQQFEDDQEIKVNQMFITVGLVLGLQNLFDKFIINHGVFYMLFALLFSGGFLFIVGRYISSYIMYGISRMLKGEAEILDIRVVVAYSQVPSLLLLPVILYLGISRLFDSVNIVTSIIVVIYGVFIWVLKIRISLIGLKYFNNYSTMKALINLTPTIIAGVLIHGLTMYFFLR